MLLPVLWGDLDFDRFCDRSLLCGMACICFLCIPCHTFHHIFQCQSGASRWDSQIHWPWEFPMTPLDLQIQVIDYHSYKSRNRWDKSLIPYACDNFKIIFIGFKTSKNPFLTEKCQHGCTINRRSQAILSLHEKLTQLPWTRAILACQHVNSISVGRWSLSRKLAICWCNRSILFTNIHNKSKNNWMLLFFRTVQIEFLIEWLNKLKLSIYLLHNRFWKKEKKKIFWKYTFNF